MPGEHYTFTTNIPIYFDSNGKYSHSSSSVIGFTIPKNTLIEIWNHGDSSKVRWSRPNGKKIQKLIHMKISDAKHLFKNKTTQD